jgi:hypothetical protein
LTAGRADASLRVPCQRASRSDGVTVTRVLAENVLDGIRPEDHRAGLEVSLHDLWRFAEEVRP